MPSAAYRALGAAIFALSAILLGEILGANHALSRLDAALMVPTLPLAALVYFALPMRWRPPALGRAIPLALAGLAALWFAHVAGSINFGSPQALVQWMWLIGGGALALLLTDGIRRVSTTWPALLRSFAYGAMLLCWWLAAHVGLSAAYRVQSPAQPGRTIVISGLPLRQWSDDMPSRTAPSEAAAVIALRSRLARSMMLLDSLDGTTLATEDRLLLAHPFALSPESLVEVDRFVRGGGRAVILADGLSGWPAAYPLGDPRNPPVTSLLTPLLDHWGVRLDAPVPGSANSEAVAVLHLGHRLVLHSPGYFAKLPGLCRGAARLPAGKATVATCRIGRGTAVLLADADMLFDPLWRPEPLWAAHLRTSDNIEWLVEQLDHPQRRPIWGLRPTWREAAYADR